MSVLYNYFLNFIKLYVFKYKNKCLLQLGFFPSHGGRQINGFNSDLLMCSFEVGLSKKMVRKVNMVEPHPIRDNNFRMVIRAKNVAWVVQSYQQVFSPRLLLSRLEESTRQEY